MSGRQEMISILVLQNITLDALILFILKKILKTY